MSIKLRWLVAILLIVSMTGGVYAQTLQRTPIDWAVIKRLSVTGTNFATMLAGSLTVANDLSVTDMAAVGNDLTVTDDLIVTDLVGTAQTVIVVTNDSTITPTGFTTWLSSTGTVGTSSIGGCATATKGKLIGLENRAATSITLTDTGTLKLSGNMALAQFDTGILQCDGTNWIQFAKTDN